MTIDRSLKMTGARQDLEIRASYSFRNAFLAAMGSSFVISLFNEPEIRE